MLNLITTTFVLPCVWVLVVRVRYFQRERCLRDRGGGVLEFVYIGIASGLKFNRWVPYWAVQSASPLGDDLDIGKFDENTDS